jgi:transcriptional regulator with XRE-family HTH domain
MKNLEGKSYGALIEGMQAYLENNYRCFNLDKLAERAGISTSLLSRIISRERNISLKTFHKLMDAFDSLGIDFSSWVIDE